MSIDDARRQDLITEAFTLAIEVWNRMPLLFRPDNNIIELKRMLYEIAPNNLSNHEWEARRVADLLQGKDADLPTQIDLRAETVDGASL